jgi:hypothetical protein
MGKFGRFLGVSGPAVPKWEKARTNRLSPINEVAVRAFLAEQLNIKLEGRFSTLKWNADTPDRPALNIA